MKELQQYTYTIPANGSVQIPATNDNFYVQASTGPVAVRGNTFGRMRAMVAGMGLRNVPFDRLELFDESGAPNTVTLLMTPAEFVNNTFSGSVTVVGGNLTDAQLRASRVLMTQAEQPSASFNATGGIAANTPQTVFPAAANPNGAIVLSAHIAGVCTTWNAQALLAKATAPATVNDGEAIAVGSSVHLVAAGPFVYDKGDLTVPQFVAPGLGLYFISAGALSSRVNACRYVLL